MTMKTEEEVVEILKRQRLEFETRIREQSERADEAEYRARVAEWALVGLVDYQVRPMLSPTLISSSKLEWSELARMIGKNCAYELLHGAGLAFKAHAAYHEALRHIEYMEMHAAGRVTFSPFNFPANPDALPTKWSWPVPFHGPFEKEKR